ncbi:MAG: hypothetical protein IIZ69_11395, partial [Pseudomonas sp.]|nr:hypothetical protein [Pseudomonas sp.]
MKKLMFATALVASAAAFAAPINAISFEGYSADATVGNTADTPDASGGDNGMYFYFDGEGDGSLVKAFGSGDVAAPSITRPLFFASAAQGNNYLELSTEGGILWRSINTLNSDTSGETPVYSLGDAEPIAATGTYLDTLVQFTPTEDGNPPEVTQDDKLAIWLSVDSSGSAPVTNLMVRAGYADGNGTFGTTNFVLTGVSVQAGQWYRLTIKAYENILVSTVEGEPAELKYGAFSIFIDGTEMSAVGGYTLASAWSAQLSELYLDGMASKIQDGTLFVSCVQGVPGEPSKLQGIGFKGSGALDDIVWTEENPFELPADGFTLTWPAGMTAVSYTLGTGSTPVAITGSSPFMIRGVEDGALIYFLVQNADGAQKLLQATKGDGVTGINATGTTFGWPEYLGAAVNGAYEIDNLAELKLFQKGIATTTNELKLATAGETFKLTTDIALDAAWPGIGVQNGKDIYSTADFNAAAFQGTFDGQNHTISGFQMVGVAGNPANNNEGLDYCGFFNSIYGATIQNLKIQYAGTLFAADSASGTKESGATFVGVAKNSTLRNLTTVAGTASCSKGFGGIVGYLAGTTVDSCTNNVNLTSLAGNKCGGIAMICQVGGCALLNCQNNGTVTTTSGEFGGIIGYTDSIVISNCQNTAAKKMFYHHGGTVTNADLKGNATVDSYTGNATPGLNFAAVDGSVATFVADGALAAGNTYKVMHTATATYQFTAAGSISFDTNMIQAVTFAITAAQGLDAPTEATENGVVTFTVAAAGGDDYVVEIDGSDVVITPQAGDLEALAEAGVDTNSIAAVNTALAQ